MIGAARVDRDPAHATTENPLGERARRPGVADEVLGLVYVRAVGPVLGIVAVVAGVDDEDVAALDAMTGVVLPTLEMLGSVEVEIAETHPLEVDNACGTDEEVEREVADELSARVEMRRCIEVGADVQRHRDLLAAGLVEREPLDPADGRARIAGEGRRVKREVLG